MTSKQIDMNTAKAMDSCRACIDEGILTSFAECMFFLAGFTKNEPVRMDVLVNAVQAWGREGLITDAWGC